MSSLIAYTHPLCNIPRNDRPAMQARGGAAPGAGQSTAQAATHRAELLASKTFRDRDLNRKAFQQDRKLGSFCQWRKPDAHDDLFGSGPEASPCKFGAPPLWLL